MAKIGTAHIEIKPVLDEEALARIADRIEACVRGAIERGVKDGTSLQLKIHGG